MSEFHPGQIELERGKLGWFRSYRISLFPYPDVLRFTLNIGAQVVAEAHGFYSAPSVFHVGHLTVLRPRLRRRGLGGRLVRAIRREMQARGVTEITTSVTDHKLAAQPFLVQWWERVGFVSQGHDPEHLNVLNLSLKLTGPDEARQLGEETAEAGRPE